MTTLAPAVDAEGNLVRSANLLARLLKAGGALTLRRDQVEPCLQAGRHRAESLLAAFRVTNDPALLREALEEYPNWDWPSNARSWNRRIPHSYTIPVDGLCKIGSMNWHTVGEPFASPRTPWTPAGGGIRSPRHSSRCPNGT